jgi:hypothetical protein
VVGVLLRSRSRLVELGRLNGQRERPTALIGGNSRQEFAS